MIYTKDNPKLVIYYSHFEGIENFTGIVKDKDGDIAYYLNGKLHREDGPAVEWCDGDLHWFINGISHREDGPAVEYANGDKAWYLNGNLHREDGPAIECADGDKEWYLNNEDYGTNDDFTNESWIRFIKLELFK